MIKVLFTQNDQPWSDEHLHHMLLSIPPDLQNKVLAYKGWQERQSRILGKRLLMKIIEHFKLEYNLSDLKYTALNKPYFEHNNPTALKSPSGGGGVKSPSDMETFDFSIAHSAGIVLCAGNTLGQIGADIERVSSRDLADYQDQLTAAEWQYIHQAPDHLMAFYDIWTRKEALMKAIGRGIDMDFDTLDVCGDTATYESKVYAFYPLFISAGYVAHLASSIPLDSESISLEALPFEPI